FVKVQDGCSFSCNFCIVPLVRGRSRSRAAAAVLDEIRRRVAQGHREVVLTGINLGCYRDREAGYTLARLLRAAGAIPALAALRGAPTACGGPVAPAPRRDRRERLRAASHQARLERSRLKVRTDDLVLVDRPGRGYGDDYSPWLVDAPVGELVRVRAAAVSEE